MVNINLLSSKPLLHFPMSVAVKDDEEAVPDFMSDSFLAQLSDVRPGLSRSINKHKNSAQPQSSSHCSKRDRQVAKQQEKQAKQMEAFQTALETPVFAEPNDSSSSSSGALTAARSMMLRMGYQPGQGLGRLGQGRLEPVPISLKSDRLGLGHLPAQPARKRRVASATAAEAESDDASSAAEFRQRMSAKFARVDVGADLARAQRACLRLDAERADRGDGDGCSPPPAAWFWPADSTVEEPGDDEAEESEEADQPSPEEQLRLIAGRLRRLHNYCLWCGQQYDYSDSLLAECPGPEKADHND